MARLKRGTGNGHVRIHAKQGKVYADLRYAERELSLGRCDPANPTALLEIVLNAIPKLTLTELLAILHADKTMREPGRPPGRPRKRARL